MLFSAPADTLLKVEVGGAFQRTQRQQKVRLYLEQDDEEEARSRASTSCRNAVGTE